MADKTIEQERQTLTGDWFGTRTRLSERGISVGSTLWLDAGVNLRGGRDTSGSGVNHLLSLNVSFDAEKLLGIKGGSAYLDFQTESSRPVSDEAGDWQGVSSLYGDGFTQVTEAWYRQELMEGRLALKAGKMEILYDFAYADNAWDFNNGAMGYPASSLVMPTYPNTAFGIDAMYKLHDKLSVGAGVFDGALAEGYETGKLGPSTLFGEPSDLYLIAEAVYQPGIVRELASELRLGVWHHTGRFSELNGDGDQSGTSGFYVILDQQLWRENARTEGDEQGIAGFVQIDFADEDVMEADVHASGGVVWKGAIDGRDADAAGLGFTWVHFADDAGDQDDGELTVETFYKIQLKPWLSIKPDLQYVVNPGGGGLRDALVAMVRLELTF